MRVTNSTLREFVRVAIIVTMARNRHRPKVVNPITYFGSVTNFEGILTAQHFSTGSVVITLQVPCGRVVL